MKLIKSYEFISDNSPKYLEFKTLGEQNVWIAFENKNPIGVGFSKNEAKNSIGKPAKVSFNKPNWLYQMGNTDSSNTQHEIYSLPVKTRNHFEALLSFDPMMPLSLYPVINKTTNELCLIVINILNTEIPPMYFTTPREKTDTIFTQMERCLFQVYIKTCSEPEKPSSKHNNLLLFWFFKWYDRLEVIKTL